jgi:hypothetical protein
MEVLQLQRTYRQGLARRHAELLAQQQQQQQPQQQEAHQQQPLSRQELAHVEVWDGFFDATLLDYQRYLRAAAAGQPSVWTTPNAGQQPQQQGQQQQQEALQQHGAALTALGHAADVLALLPTSLKQRPTHITGASATLKPVGCCAAGCS